MEKIEQDNQKLISDLSHGKKAVSINLKDYLHSDNNKSQNYNTLSNSEKNKKNQYLSNFFNKLQNNYSSCSYSKTKGVTNFIIDETSFYGNVSNVNNSVHYNFNLLNAEEEKRFLDTDNNTLNDEDLLQTEMKTLRTPRELDFITINDENSVVIHENEKGGFNMLETFKNKKEEKTITPVKAKNEEINIPIKKLNNETSKNNKLLTSAIKSNSKMQIPTAKKLNKSNSLTTNTNKSNSQANLIKKPSEPPGAKKTMTKASTKENILNHSFSKKSRLSTIATTTSEIKKDNLKLNDSKNILKKSHSNLSRKGPIKSSNPKAIKTNSQLNPNTSEDILSDLEGIFGNNLENFDENILYNTLEDFNSKFLIKSLIFLSFEQKKFIKDLNLKLEQESKEINELRKEVGKKDDVILGLEKELRGVKLSLQNIINGGENPKTKFKDPLRDSVNSLRDSLTQKKSSHSRSNSSINKTSTQNQNLPPKYTIKKHVI